MLLVLPGALPLIGHDQNWSHVVAEGIGIDPYCGSRFGEDDTAKCYLFWHLHKLCRTDANTICCRLANRTDFAHLRGCGQGASTIRGN